MPKAVVITEENHRKLEEQFSLEEDELSECTGKYLVADFGADFSAYGVLSKGGYVHYFTPTGVELQNGFVEVAKRSVV